MDTITKTYRGNAIRKQSDGEGRYLELYFVDTDGADSDNDTYDGAKAFAGMQGRKVDLGQYQHIDNGQLPYGVGSIEFDGSRGYWAGYVNDSDRGKEFYQYATAKGDSLEMSYVFNGKGDRNDLGGLHFTEVDILSVDAVKRAAGRNTGLRTAKDSDNAAVDIRQGAEASAEGATRGAGIRLDTHLKAMQLRLQAR